METKTDSRAFPEIWGALNKDEKAEVTYRIIADRCAINRQTVWNWATGKTQPTSPLIKKAVAASVGKALGIRVLPATLFPAR